MGCIFGGGGGRTSRVVSKPADDAAMQRPVPVGTYGDEARVPLGMYGLIELEIELGPEP